MAARVVEIVPVREVPLAVVEIVPVRVVEIVPLLVVEMVPVFPKVGTDISETNTAAQTIDLTFFIACSYDSSVCYSGRLGVRLLSHLQADL